MKSETNWLRHLGGKGKLKMICFPHSGGGSNAYRTWPTNLPPFIEVYGITLPGREYRFGEPLISELTKVVDGLFGELLSVTQSGTSIFFGHSLGAKIAFETIREMRRKNFRLPEYLFVSGNEAPQIPEDEIVHALPREEFIAKLKEYQGVSEEVFQEEELLEICIPIIRSDLKIGEMHVYQDEAPLACPISAFYGTDDTIETDEIQAWAMQTQVAFKMRVYPGGHFYLQELQKRLLQDMLEDLSPLIQSLK